MSQMISSKTYATEVEDLIENTLEDALFCVLYNLGKKFNLDQLCSISDFQDIYTESYSAYLRDVVIKFFEECGLDIFPDGKDF